MQVSTINLRIASEGVVSRKHQSIGSQLGKPYGPTLAARGVGNNIRYRKGIPTGIGRIERDSRARLESSRVGPVCSAQVIEQRGNISCGELPAPADIKGQDAAGADSDIGCHPVGSVSIVKRSYFCELQNAAHDTCRATVGIASREDERATAIFGQAIGGTRYGAPYGEVSRENRENPRSTESYSPVTQIQIA